MDKDYGFEHIIVSKTDTGLPCDLVLESSGVKKHSQSRIPTISTRSVLGNTTISISDKPEVITNHNTHIGDIDTITKWIARNKELLLEHWNKELTDREVLLLLKK